MLTATLYLLLKITINWDNKADGSISRSLFLLLFQRGVGSKVHCAQVNDDLSFSVKKNHNREGFYIEKAKNASWHSIEDRFLGIKMYMFDARSIHMWEFICALRVQYRKT